MALCCTRSVQEIKCLARREVYGSHRRIALYGMQDGAHRATGVHPPPWPGVSQGRCSAGTAWPQIPVAHDPDGVAASVLGASSLGAARGLHVRPCLRAAPQPTGQASDDAQTCPVVRTVFCSLRFADIRMLTVSRTPAPRHDRLAPHHVCAYSMRITSADKVPAKRRSTYRFLPSCSMQRGRRTLISRRPWRLRWLSTCGFVDAKSGCLKTPELSRPTIARFTSTAHSAIKPAAFDGAVRGRQEPKRCD